MILILFLDVLRTATPLEVALFPLTGCYSHDVMMKDVGLGMPPGTNITWIQMFLYDFGFGEIDLPSNWTRIRLWGYDEDSEDVMNTAGRLMWELNLPADFDQPWDLRGSHSVSRMIRRHQCFCETFSEDHRLRQYLMSQKTDLIVLDHLLQECMGGLASLLNAPIVQYSNWPIADGYVTSMNIPANPSSTPKTATPYSSLGMSFFQRVANVLFHWNIIIARFLQRIWLLETFQRSNLPEVDLIASEAQRIIYAGRSEFLFEVIRPINNRVKHFASNIQLRPSDFVTVIPESCGSETRDGCLCNRISCVLSAEHKLNTSSQLHSTSDYLYSHDFIRHVPEPVKRESLYKNLDRKLVKKRFDTVSMAFPQLHWPSLTNEKFILATFGSLAKAEYIPLDIARKIISAFSRSPYKVIWQTNSPLDSLGWIRNVTIPQNVVLTRWAPVKEMLAHPNLQYLICHGGINTINEVLLFGVPFIGVYLQGDQGSNVRRLADLGAAVMVSVHQISQEELLPIMRKFERNLESYWKRAAQLSSMLEHYRELHVGDQAFWISWTTRHGKSLRDRNLFRMNYIGDTENVFWFTVAAVLSTLFLVVCN
ncbi:hypothetical protein Y032_0178g659 [Ancylostoma ceylanicum]|nr:hypothetical protein Y032_0178g659 [Ancylostoma ceylanicum]